MSRSIKNSWALILWSIACAIPRVVVAQTASLAPLAQGEAPDCPKRSGTRDFRSEVVSYGARKAYIAGSATRQGSNCQKALELHLKSNDLDSTYPIQPEDRSYFIVDYSPDHSKLLLYIQTIDKYPNEQFRNIDISVMNATSGQMTTRNAWDLFGWKNCDAMVEPQGFTADGDPVVLARPSVMRPPRRDDCVADWGLYRLEKSRGTVSRLPDATRLQRYASVAASATKSCATDPDVVGECFVVHGRLSFWNGSPTARIWWIGTHRMLGVSDEIIPDAVAKRIKWGVEAYGDFRVCPMEKPTKGAMQDICIDTAKNVIYRSPDKR